MVPPNVPPTPAASAPAAPARPSLPNQEAMTQPMPAVPRPSTPAMTAPAAPPAPPAAPPAPPGGPRRLINPFLNNDPNQKAKRLARALVSDMVAYLPQKREEGLKNGTLKELFREEIKKSYEEYCDQIGKEFAETTTHFQDALNDVLSGGKKIF
jgi:hypothetical protein